MKDCLYHGRECRKMRFNLIISFVVWIKFFFLFIITFFSWSFLLSPKLYTSSPNTMGPLWFLTSDACVLTMMAEDAAISFLAHKSFALSLVIKRYPLIFHLGNIYFLTKLTSKINLQEVFNTSRCKPKKQKHPSQPNENMSKSKKLFHKQKWCMKGGEGRNFKFCSRNPFSFY